MKPIVLIGWILISVMPLCAGETAATAEPTDIHATILDAREVAIQNPEDTDALMNLAGLLGQAMRENPRYNGPLYADETVGALKKVINLDPKRADAYIGLAYFYLNAPARVGGSVRKAEELASKLSEFDTEKGKELKAVIQRHGERGNSSH